jgi:hypothetical protein
VINTINSAFIPVYIATEDYGEGSSGTSPEEKAARSKMLKEAWREKTDRLFMTSDAACFVIDPKTEQCVHAIRLPDLLDSQKVLDMLNGVIQEFHVVKGNTVIAPKPQVGAEEPIKEGEIELHLLNRYIPPGGTWKQLPAEDWIVLARDEWQKLLPPGDAKVGLTYSVDKEVSDKILLNFYPPSSNRVPETNRIDSPAMKATVVSVKNGVARVRLDNQLKMKHHFLPAKDDSKFVEATVVGFADVDLTARQIKDVQMVTEKATYGDEDGKNGFGAALRLVRHEGGVAAKK